MRPREGLGLEDVGECIEPLGNGMSIVVPSFTSTAYHAIVDIHEHHLVLIVLTAIYTHYLSS